MPAATAHRFEFAPPATQGSLRAMGLAVVAHALLLAALTWGVRWNNEPVLLTAEAELWSAVPQQAAPRLVEVPVPPAPAPAPIPTPRVRTPAPEPPRKAAPETPPVTDARIVLEREKRRVAQEKLADEKLQQAQKAAKLEKQATEKQRLEDKRELDRQLADDKKKTELALKRKDALQAQEEASKVEVQRQENIKRMAGLAGATGAADAAGTAQKASGPSSGYGARLRARIKPNIVFTEDISGNPTAEVEVLTSPDGTITSSKLLKSSGVPAWDRAVLKAIDKTETLPRDVDGRVPPSLVISFRPKD